MMAPMSRQLLRGFLLPGCLLASCASEPSEPADPPLGIPAHVEILDGQRVRYDDQTVPLETFLYDMRTKVRSAAGRPAQMPVVTIVIAQSAGPQASLVLERVVRQLHAAGVHRVQIGGGP